MPKLGVHEISEFLGGSSDIIIAALV